MGVRGLTSILTEAINSLASQNKKDKNDDSESHPISSCLPPRQFIPQGSVFAIDGYGLAYYIHTQAYQIHYNYILDLVKQNMTKTKKNDIHEELDYTTIISSLLPSLVPLELISNTCHSILRDWVQKAGLYLYIYLDHPTLKNPLKQSTIQSRQVQQEQLEGQLQDFLLHSSLPSSWGTSTSTPLTSSSTCMVPSSSSSSSSSGNQERYIIPSYDTFLNTFPRSSSKLWFLQILHEIQTFQSSHAEHVTIIQCPGEADVDVAFHAADDVSGDTYCVGNDSDYFLFGGKTTTHTEYGEISYIPLESIQWNHHPSQEGGDFLEATIWTRSLVVQLLGLPDEASLIELSILLGNDYTKPFLTSIQDIENHTDLFDDSNMNCLLSHLGWKDRVRIQLCHRGVGYRVSSTHDGLNQAIRYSRDLYSFQDLSKYLLVVEDTEKEEDADINHLIDRIGLGTFPIQIVRFQQADIIVSLIAQQQQQDTLRYRIRSALQQYYQNHQTSERPWNEHAIEEKTSLARRFILSNWVDYISALDQSLLPERRTIPTKSFLFPSKLNWYDYCMMVLIERLIHVGVKSSLEESHHDSNFFPSYHGMFHTHCFLTSLISARKKINPTLTKHIKPQKHIRSNPSFPLPTSAHPTPHRPTSTVLERMVLPIDEFKGTILQTIQDQRVTVIQGETGSGKSTRVPFMILEAPAPDPSVPRVKMFITQPRRIAAKALVEHVRASEPMLRHKFALRLGHGIREYESASVQAWFCTTGYLVRYLANYPDKFKTVTHLIIDEVHERSVETDLLCLLTKRLLSTFSHLRVILMSATIAAEMYTEYFDVPQSPICVSGRKFPIREYFLEDLHQIVSLPTKEKKAVDEILAKVHKQKGPVVPSTFELEQLYHLAVFLAKAIGSHGSSILIFVAGMMDIVCISELIKKIVIPGKTFTCLPIHSDVPIEDQMVVFQPAGPNEVKIIIATNAAESSITLPDIDHVICMGICKQIMYKEYSHRQILGPCRISKASARQRAGRTGRVREGSVYRLYSRKTFELHMDPFETGEILRMPLDSVILSIKDMIPDEGVSELLSRLIEPPEQGNISRSLEALFKQRFLTEATEKSHLTSLGSFVVALGIDLCLGTLIGLGFILGLPAEAITLAAVLSFPKSPWSIANASFHEPSKYNELIVNSYSSKAYFDNGLYSEPLAAINMLHDYELAKNKSAFTYNYSLSLSRVKQLYSTVHHLQSRVASALGYDNQHFRLAVPPRDLPLSKQTALRLLNVFTFPDYIITSIPRLQLRDDGLHRVMIKNTKEFQDDMLHRILDPVKFPYTINRKQRLVYTGCATYDNEKNSKGPTEQRLLSYGLEKNFQIILLYEGLDCIQAFIPQELSDQLRHHLGIGFVSMASFVCRYSESLNMRGIRGRACGVWSIVRECVDLEPRETKSRLMSVFSFYDSHERTKKRLKEMITILMMADIEFLALAYNELPNNVLGFTATTYGNSKDISSQDASDLFLCSKLNLKYGGIDSLTVDFVQSRHNLHSLIADIPVGARILAALACGHRKKHVVTVSKDVDDENSCVELQLVPSETRFVDRWTHLESKSKVFVDNCSIPASAYDTGAKQLFSCCASYLEVKGGNAKVEGLTFLPPDPHFLALALTCVGFPIPSTLSLCSSHPDKELGPSLSYHDRHHEALLFRSQMNERSDTLICDKNLVNDLCEIFDLEPWPVHGDSGPS